MRRNEIMHYYGVSQIYIGIDSSGEIEYHVRASVNKIEGVGETLEEAFKNLRDKLQYFTNHRIDIED